ncbi:hypothetical protein BDN72DRAFT_959197 [Pluteus cervinus]|uniref:Uncharacterized protein n=1 Tax=Pluteus cervinus TaxID=181527 RepID=A0ACD3AVM8_9AGAR|nr:hypothetical protein BDN72DRAFT_959197 [Pluteus cervinus]
MKTTSQNPPGHKQSSDMLRLDSEQLHIMGLTMKHENNFLRRFLVEISVIKEFNIVKTYKSTKEPVKKGKLQWTLNISVPIASAIKFKVMKHHAFKPDEVITTISISFLDIVKFFKENQQSNTIDLQGSQGKKLCLSVEQKSIQALLQGVTLPLPVLERLGNARQPVEFLLGISDQLGELNSIAKGVLTLFSKAYEQLEKQELCTQQVAILVDQINLYAPIIRTAHDLEDFENLQKVIQDILHLIQEVLDAIFSYNEKHPIGQIWDLFKTEPSLDSERFSTRFKDLLQAFSSSLAVDKAEQDQVESALNKLQPNLKQPAAFCAENTCVDILQVLDDWAKSQSDKLFWLHGVAGMGKSTIAATLSNRLNVQKLLGGYHICSRDSATYQSPSQLVLNLCSQLAQVYKPFGRQIAKAIRANNLFAPNGMQITELFDFLLIQPLEILHSNQQKPTTVRILIIDALDECGSSEERHSDPKIGTSTQLLPSVNVEQHLQKETARTWSLDPTNNDSNIQQFFKLMFQQKDFKSDLDELLGKIPALTTQASGLFIWAKTAYEYLKLSLDKVAAINTLLQKGTFNNLHFLYETVLKEAIPLQDRNIYQIVMGAILLAQEPLSEKGISRLLVVGNGLKESIVVMVISRLNTLIYVGKDERLYIMHPSLREYLTNSEVQSDFSIAQEQHYTLFVKTVGVMNQQLKFNICELKSSCETNSEVKDLEERVKSHVSEELQYSARYWMYHMMKSGEWSSNHDKALENLGSNNTLLYWIEVLSLLGCVRKTMLELTKVVQWMKGDTKFRMYLDEISTFLSQFITPVSESVCHIYISALAHVPEQSWMAKQFWGSFEKRLKIKNTEAQKWEGTQRYTRVLKLKGHDNYVRSVTFSSDNKYVVSGSSDKTIRIWDVETRQQRGTEFRGHTSYVTSVAFSSDDKYVVSGSIDNTVRIWDVETGQQKGIEFKGHTDYVRSVAFSSDDKYVVSGSDDVTIIVYITTQSCNCPPITGLFPSPTMVYQWSIVRLNCP